MILVNYAVHFEVLLGPNYNSKFVVKMFLVMERIILYLLKVLQKCCSILINPLVAKATGGPSKVFAYLFIYFIPDVAANVV